MYTILLLVLVSGFCISLVALYTFYALLHLPKYYLDKKYRK